MKLLTWILVILTTLAACADPGSVYIGFLNSHDRGIFRNALRIEEIPEANEEALIEPWTWVVVYGKPFDSNGATIPVLLGHNAIVLRHSGYRFKNGECSRDRIFHSSARHELGHSQGKRHVSNPSRIMHADPTPCWPSD